MVAFLDRRIKKIIPSEIKINRGGTKNKSTLPLNGYLCKTAPKNVRRIAERKNKHRSFSRENIENIPATVGADEKNQSSETKNNSCNSIEDTSQSDNHKTRKRKRHDS